MLEFSSVQEMLERHVFQKIEEHKENLLNGNNDLKMTTTWLVDEGIEIIFCHEKLDVPFKNMKIIVNSTFFEPCWPRMNSYSDAYHQLSGNAKWESIDTLVKRGKAVEVSSIAFISLVSCFKGKSSDRDPNLASVIEHITYPSSGKRLLVVLSSEEEKQKKLDEIKVAIKSLLNIFNGATVDEFRIAEKGGGYYGFTATF